MHLNKMRPWVLLIIFGFVCVGIAKRVRGQTGENVEVSTGINHDDYDRLLKKYVNDRGLRARRVFEAICWKDRHSGPGQRESSHAGELLQRVRASLDFVELSN